MKQKEQADKNCRKLLKEERRRIIKSATRRNPQAISDAIYKSKLALKEHNEWKSNLLQSKINRIMTSKSSSTIKDYMETQSRASTTLEKKLSNEKIQCLSSQNSASKILITENYDAQGEEEPEIINVGDSNIFEDY